MFSDQNRIAKGAYKAT